MSFSFADAPRSGPGDVGLIDVGLIDVSAFGTFRFGTFGAFGAFGSGRLISARPSAQ
ncbi:hypothetical protein [Streptomyces europaeiscabiei]|uniref:Uncharacterized protein n=1 Tax=Streptomyces europaeiscabiei TaxID=146819 RepID=A0ABU4NQN7_9ACTN|nr:hypothetical protein [Streptomyces europaeiscabiei]MDX3547748.1 hypothetical protein [Streptomyces europaeiscabiei]MDX3557618.1 hypothetical protein [Streptomyces europaeiscabiei]MDX3705385.1 hypothetical protein [Streptomyces europaeiscabiei]MDX3783180.1 hypothetical protein [Streptomyces europaeiscabiei]